VIVISGAILIAMGVLQLTVGLTELNGDVRQFFDDVGLGDLYNL
ncbi:MAG: hypothetical protein QOI80_3247, partial [Solirubrobacteraceae bacterium]|nr:hypothetical protein [Solirubrobacteraceae bacterium]